MDYDPNEIVVLEGLEAVRRRPGMYIGGTDIKALHNMLYEVLDNSINEALAGRVNRINVILRSDSEMCIQDNSPGYPVDLHVPTQLSKLELRLTKLRTGSDTLRSYFVVGGFHGIGIQAINALSEWLVVETTADGFQWRQTYKMGVPQTPVEQMRPLKPDEPTGISISFKPDFTIFASNTFDYEMIAKRCREVSFLIEGLTVHLRDEREKPIREETFHKPNGLVGLVSEMAQSADPVHRPIGTTMVVKVPYGRNQNQGYAPLSFQFAFVFTRGELSAEIGFANTVQTEGGTHTKAMRRGILRFVNHSRNGNPSKPLRWKEIAPHIAAVISVLLPSPQFINSMRTELLNPEIERAITKTVYKTFKEFAASHPDEMKEILQVCRG